MYILVCLTFKLKSVPAKTLICSAFFSTLLTLELSDTVNRLGPVLPS